MRTWTLFVSVCAHAAVIGAMIVAPLFAVGELPEPRRVSTWAIVTPIQLPPPVPVTPRSERTRLSADPAPTPIAEPPDVRPETPLDVAPHSSVEFGVPSGNGVPPGDVISAGDSAPPPPRPPAAPIVRVGGVVQAPKRVTYVAPVYPRLALDSHREGTVILEAVIDEKGTVREVRILRSIPLLDDAAVEAVGQWRFTPTLLNGQPVPVVMTVTVGFTLK